MKYKRKYLCCQGNEIGAVYFRLIPKSLFFLWSYDIVSNMNFFGRVRQVSKISFISFCVKNYAKYLEVA